MVVPCAVLHLPFHQKERMMDFSTGMMKCVAVDQLANCADVLKISQDEMVVVGFDEEGVPIWAKEINPGKTSEDLIQIRLSTIVSYAKVRYPGVPLNQLYWVTQYEGNENGSYTVQWQVFSSVEVVASAVCTH